MQRVGRGQNALCGWLTRVGRARNCLPTLTEIAPVGKK